MKVLVLASLLGFTTLMAPEAVSIRLAGDTAPVAGIVVDGKDYVPVDQLAAKLGAKVQVDRTSTGQRQLIWSPGEAPLAKGFDDGPENMVTLFDDAKSWHTIDGSKGKMRVRDFVKGSDGWKLTGELEVAPESVLVDGRIPRGPATLQFYVVCRDREGKSVSRYLISVPKVSYEGGRYPITVNGYYGGSTLPATVSLRYNGAEEYIAPEQTNGGG